MKKKLKCYSALVVAISMIFTSGCGLTNILASLLFAAPSYANRQYTEPDEQALYADIEEIENLAKTSGNQTKIAQKRTQIFTDYYSVYTSNIVAEIEYYKDITNTENQKRNENISKIFNKLNNRIIEMEQRLFSSQYKDYLISITSEEYAQSILDREIKDQELLDLEEKETELVSQYSQYSDGGDENKLADIYKQLIITRNKIAAKHNDKNGEPYANYMDYAYAEVYGRDYTPQSVNDFASQIASQILPLAKKLLTYASKFNKDLYLSEKNLKDYAYYVISQTAPDMKENWNYMLQKELYDFTDSENKMNVSFVVEFPQYRDGFMFINANRSLNYDLNTVLHEFGHYNAIFAEDDEKSGAYDIYNYDLAETHSQAFELITLPAINNLFNQLNISEYYDSYSYNLFVNSLWSMLSNCAFNDFEYTVYTAEESALDKDFFNSTFTKSSNAFWGNMNYKYYQIPHLYQSPAYCISYSVSMVFASEIWAGPDNIETYLELLPYGKGHYLDAICEELGLKSPLSSQTITDIANAYTAAVNDILN